MFKKCTQCNLDLEKAKFSIRKASKDGLNASCKDCMSALRKRQYQENPDKHKKRAREYRANNLELCREKGRESSKKRTLENPEYFKEYYKNNKEKWKYVPSEKKKARAKAYWAKHLERRKEYSREYEKNNKEINLQKRREYKKRNKHKVAATNAARRSKKQKATFKGFNREFDMIFDQALKLNMQVDHIIPINHKDVCGLHVPWNLQLLPAKENLVKSNQFDGTYENESWRLNL